MLLFTSLTLAVPENITISSYNDVKETFNQYVDYVYALNYFLDIYKEYDTVLDYSIMFLPTHTYSLSKELVNTDEDIQTSLWSANIFFKFSFSKHISVYSLLCRIYYSNEIMPNFEGYGSTNVITGIRLSIDLFSIQYAIIQEYGLEYYSYPIPESIMPIFFDTITTLAYRSILAPFLIYADIYEGKFYLDLLRIDLDLSNILALLNRMNLFFTSLATIRTITTSYFELDLLFQYAKRSLHSISCGFSLSLYLGNNKISFIPNFDMKTILDKVQLVFFSEYFTIHVQADIEDWQVFPQIGISAEIKPTNFFSFGLSYNDLFFNPFQKTKEFTVYGRLCATIKDAFVE